MEELELLEAGCYWFGYDGCCNYCSELLLVALLVGVADGVVGCEVEDTKGRC